MTDPFVTDRDLLLQQYADGTSLDARANLYAWQQPRHDLVATVLSYVPADADHVLDVGCGRGQYLAGLGGMHQSGIGLDLSDGMAAEARARTEMSTIVGDAEELPIGDDTIDATLALHLLNHLDDPVAALSEWRRVTRPGGVVIVLTNTADHIAEYLVLAGEAAGLDGPLRSTDRPLAEDRALLASSFDRVSEVRLDGVISVDRPGPLLDYARSARDFYELQMDVAWDRFEERFDALLSERIGRDGTIDITASTTVFVAEVGS